MKVTFEIQGLKELAEGLATERPKATATNVQKRVLKELAEPFEADAKRFAPVRTGLLREKVNISTKLSPRQRGTKKESKIEVYVGPPSMTRGVVAEFGSVKQAPHPFMRPAFDANKQTAFNKLKDALAEEIDKARQRIARKTARLAAKAAK